MVRRLAGLCLSESALTELIFLSDIVSGPEQVISTTSARTKWEVVFAQQTHEEFLRFRFPRA